VGQDDRIYRSMGIFESDEAGERVKYTQDVPMAAAKAIRAAVTKVSFVGAIRWCILPRRNTTGCIDARQ